MRLSTAAAQTGIGRMRLERWMRHDVIHIVQSGRQRTIPHTELPVLRKAKLLEDAGFTVETAFALARITEVKRPQAEDLWYIKVTEHVTLALKITQDDLTRARGYA